MTKNSVNFGRNERSGLRTSNRMGKVSIGDSKLFDIQNLVEQAQWRLLRCCGGLIL